MVEKILDFIKDTGIVKYIFLLMIIAGIGESLTPAIEVISSKLSEPTEKSQRDVNVINMEGSNKLKAMKGTVIGDSFKFSDKFSYSDDMSPAAFLWENGYLTEFESGDGLIYIYTNNNGLIKDDYLAGYFVPISIGTKLQSSTNEKAYLDVVVPIYNLDMKTTISL